MPKKQGPAGAVVDDPILGDLNTEIRTETVLTSAFSTSKHGWLWIEGLNPGEVFLVLEIRKRATREVVQKDRIRFEVNFDRVKVKRTTSSGSSEWEPNDLQAPNGEELMGRNHVGAERDYGIIDSQGNRTENPVGYMKARLHSLSPLLTWQPNKPWRSGLTASMWIGLLKPETKPNTWVQAGLLKEWLPTNAALSTAPIVKETVYYEFATNFAAWNPIDDRRELWIRQDMWEKGVHYWPRDCEVKIRTKIGSLEDELQIEIIDSNTNKALARRTVTNNGPRNLRDLTLKCSKAQALFESSSTVTRVPGTPDDDAYFGDIEIRRRSETSEVLPGFGIAHAKIELQTKTGATRFANATNGSLSLLHYNVTVPNAYYVRVWDKYKWGWWDTHFVSFPKVSVRPGREWE